MARVRVILWTAVALAALGLLFLLTKAPEDRPLPQPKVEAFDIGGPFTLTDSNGDSFSSQQLSGEPYLIFFGFTHCPDVCPTTLARLVKLRKQAGLDAFQLPIVFVSVDPERDDPETMASYGALFGEPVIALTGTTDEIDAVKKKFGIYSKKIGTGDAYSVDHTATVFMMDGQGRLAGTIAPDEGDAVALQKIAKLGA